MEKSERLELKLLNEMKNYLRSSMLNSREDSAKLIYEFCFLRLLSIKAFKQIVSLDENIDLSMFVNEYRKYQPFFAEESMDKEKNDDSEISFSDIDKALYLSDRVLEDLNRYMHSLKDISKLLKNLCSYNGCVIKNLMMIDLYSDSREEFATPDQICKLSSYILDINKNDKVLDICSGYGNYLINLTNCSDYQSLTGIEINYDMSLISDIRLFSLASSYTILNNNVFDIDFVEKYNKVFCNYPLGIHYEKHVLEYIEKKTSNMRFNWVKLSGSSLDWLFVNLAVSAMSEHGKAVIMMPAGPLFKTVDDQYRKELVENNLIESVIKIPNLTGYIQSPQYLLVLGKNTSDRIKFVDVSEQVEKNSPSKEIMNMSKVFEILNDDNNSLVKSESKEVLRGNGYILTVENYIGKKEVIYHNPRKLSEFVIDVFRGYQITSNEQKELESENGSYEVLLISDINDGIISNKLTKIEPNKGKYDRYLLKENDLIISSKGTRIKIAVVENIDNRKIIASGNLIVLRLDTTKLNPNYLEMYLNSSDGQTILNHIQTGSVIISINPSKLTEITISTLPIEKQNIIADKYKNKKKQIQIAKEHVFKLEQEHENFFETNVEEMFD